eukprot:GHVT01015550.1.p1 GENE.GHVT01015550.1~~GHVT01015550.1.p1  ORF type:complete len:167 (-),score=5.64 GHVT01015550.1:702-1202(-)
MPLLLMLLLLEPGTAVRTIELVVIAHSSNTGLHYCKFARIASTVSCSSKRAVDSRKYIILLALGRPSDILVAHLYSLNHCPVRNCIQVICSPWGAAFSSLLGIASVAHFSWCVYLLRYRIFINTIYFPHFTQAIFQLLLALFLPLRHFTPSEAFHMAFHGFPVGGA